MLINSVPINNEQINGEITFAEGVLLSIGKNIAFREAYDGEFITVGKIVKNTTAARSLITVGKRIQNGNNNFYTRNGWEPIIVLNTIVITASELHGGIVVRKGEGENSTAEFTIILSPAIYDIYSYQGKSVSISVRQSGHIYKIFTGIVDVPQLNVLEEKLTLKCVADRRVLLNNLDYLEPYIGMYSATVLGTNEDIASRINSRMSCIPSSLDFDSNNNYSITSWTPKGSADFTYGSSAVYRRNPDLSIDSSGEIVNQYSINISYGYQRHHQRYATYYWEHPYCPTDYSTGVGGICDFLADMPTMPSKDMILTAMNAANWPVDTDSIYFGKQFLAGSYNCSGVWVQWATAAITWNNQPVLDANGNQVVDSSGNNVSKVIPQSITDYTDVYTMYAQWNASKRFSQNIKEVYSVVVKSPESITRYGTIEQNQTYGYTGSDRYYTWENDTNYALPPTGETFYTDGGSGSYFFNDTHDRATFNNAFICAINKAKTDILKTHRKTRITFQRPLTPTMELKHTVSLTGKWIRGRGKCANIIHYLNVSDNANGVGGEAYTDVTLLQFRGNTTVSETALAVPTPPSDTYVLPQPTVTLQTHLGEDPTGAGAEYWNGYIGNLAIDKVEYGYINHTRTYYQESFIVDTPAIPGQIRDDKQLASSATYNINIPNDNVVYEAYG